LIFGFLKKKTKTNPTHLSLARSFQGGATIWDAPHLVHGAIGFTKKNNWVLDGNVAVHF
jgi:hypothetical protein